MTGLEASVLDDALNTTSPILFERGVPDANFFRNVALGRDLWDNKRHQEPGLGSQRRENLAMLQVGCGKADITAFKRGVGMLGYGQHFNTMEGIETPLHARAVIFIDEDGSLFCFVNVELAFVTQSLKCGVLDLLARQAPELGVVDHNLMLTAQHTHSGPSGFSFHCLYNLTTPGFVAEIYQRIVKGIVASIVAAHRNSTAATVSFGRGEFSVWDQVGVIRSVRAFNRNPEVEKPIDEATAHLGINREMTLLKITSAGGADLGCITWFGVHATNLANDNKKVCGDNKGYAAGFFEDAFAGRSKGSFRAIFAQGACGDVSPKIVRNSKHRRQHGKYDGKFPDDIESAKFNGKLQYEKALEIYGRTDAANSPGTRVRCFQRVQDFGDIEIDPEFAQGRSGLKTGPGCFGISFAGGTKLDGPGVHPIMGGVFRQLARIVKLHETATAIFAGKSRSQSLRRKYSAQGEKHIFVESGERRMLGIKRIDRMLVPGFVDPVIRNFKRFHRTGAIDAHPWTPQILPVQLVFMGNIALAAFPFEITTVAGQRLSASLLSLLKSQGIEQVILCPYANAYSGYVTTAEEYHVQMYEGGHTLFGQWTLAALQTAFKRLIEDLKCDCVEYESGYVLPDATIEVNDDDTLAVRSTGDQLHMLDGETSDSGATGGSTGSSETGG